ncbi:spore coat associated protein CotJA [Anaerosporobacter sp.]|uniref:spore coat associated protein CotJA n=1 Tax=Anaerosporobacter sp. TaxID=1872529 RepID=UPI00286EFC49|nr:spore coat associated protein CotJA [Anaerosporobacter sp.]
MSGAPYRYSSLEGIEGNVSVTAYVARQKWSYVYDADTALREGSIFPELIEAYKGKEGESGECD